MGVQGLLPLLDDISERVHVSEYKGKRIAVDGYVWLHKGAYGCADELARGISTTKYVSYGLHRARMLKYHGVTPVIVLDGATLPSKGSTESDRDRRRTEALARGRQLVAEGKDSLAREHFVKAVDVTPQMAYQLIKALRLDGIECIVAPYEADAQLAYLEKTDYVDAVLTEDSDLLVFGCRSTLYKLDSDGYVTQILRRDFTKCLKARMDGWRDDTFRGMCILSGCDYLEGIRGVGLKTAHKLIREFRSIPHVIAHLRKTTNSVPMDYNAQFDRADRTFLYQRVYCPFAKKLVHLNPPPKNVDVDTEWPFVGSHQDDEYARGVAEGQIDPVTREAMVDIAPDAFKDTPARRDKTNAPVKVEPIAKSNSLLSFFEPVPLDRSSSVKKATPVRKDADPKVQDEKPEVRAHRPSKFFRSDTADAAVDHPVDIHDPVTLLSPRSSQAFVEAVKSEHDAPCELVSPPPAAIARHQAFPAAPSSPSVRSPSRRKRLRSESSNLMCITSPATVIATPSPHNKRIKREPGLNADADADVKPRLRSSSQVAYISSPALRLKSEKDNSPFDLFDEQGGEDDRVLTTATDDTTPEPAVQEPEADAKPEVGSKPSTSSRRRKLVETGPNDWTPSHSNFSGRPNTAKAKRERRDVIDVKPDIRNKHAQDEGEAEAEEEEEKPVSASIASGWRAKWGFQGSASVRTPTTKAQQQPEAERPKAPLSMSVPRPRPASAPSASEMKGGERARQSMPVKGGNSSSNLEETPMPQEESERGDSTATESVSSQRVVITNKKLLAFRFTGYRPKT